MQKAKHMSGQTPAKEFGKSEVVGPFQAVAGGLKRWLLMLASGMGLLAIVAGFMGSLVVASMLVSIVIVSVTLYLFLRFWPEDEAPKQPVKAQPVRQPVMVSAVRIDAPRARFVMALKDMVRREQAFRLSPQGAERFARTIRYMLKHLD